MTQKYFLSLIAVAVTAACTGDDSSSGTTATDGGPGAGNTDAGGGGNDGGGGVDAGACVATATVTDVVKDAPGPLGRVAFDDTSVYVPGKGGADEGIFRYPRAAGASGTPLATTALSFVTPDLAVLAGGKVYFVGASSGTIYSATATGGDATYATVATGYELLAQRRLAADADAVYILAYKSSKAVLDRIPLNGDAAQTLTELPNGQWNMFVAANDVFVSGGPIGATGVKRVPKTGGTPQDVVSDRQCLFGLAVTADTVYCADTNNLVKVPRAGGAATTLYQSTGIDRIESVTFSADASTAYIGDAMGQGNSKAARIVKVDTATGTATTLACNLGPPHHLVASATTLAWTTQFVNVNGTNDVQFLGL
jgi:hypothetical protein